MMKKIELAQTCGNTMVEEMLLEYDANGEICHPYRFSENADTKNFLYYLISDYRLVGVARYTPELRNPCHGNIGISIRPSERGKGHGRQAIAKLIAIAVQTKGYATACIAETNTKSIAAFTSCGMKETGKTYEWLKNGTVTKAVEYAYGNLHQTD